MSTGTATPATTTLPARIREALSSGDAALCGRLYDWIADHDDETMARVHGLPRTAVLVLLADVADAAHTYRDDTACPRCHAPYCHRSPEAVAQRRADVFMSDGGEI